MTLLINCNKLSKAFGSRQLFSLISFGVFQGDQIGLIGPNGSGKSTLLKILAGEESPDDGSVACRKSIRVGYVPQSATYPALSIEEILMQALSVLHIPHHEKQTKINILLSKMGFKNGSQIADSLSGGWKKRLDIAKELIVSPDILLLDEPTNHLDLEGILWLENFLRYEVSTFIVTSHDRCFLNSAVSKMMELNPVYPQGLLSCDGTYSEFLIKKEDFLNQQQQNERTLASKTRNEIEWLRQTPKARTTKSQARVQSADRMIQELSEIRSRNKQSNAKIDFESSDKLSRKLLTTKNVSKSIAGRLLFSGLDLTLSPGTRLGIVGPNGCGKTTLLKLLKEELMPDMGTIKFADGVRIIYFDQHRQTLPPNATLRNALSPNSDTVIYRGQSIHVNSWAKRFLFPPDRLDLPVKQLSGGERARIAIARLMLQPADILLLDEPTNDLDIATLETLEESLKEFPGAIVLITHDRALLENTATCVLGLGFSTVPPLLADYSQWEQFIKEQETSKGTSESAKKNAPIKNEPAPISPSPKLSFKEKKELEQMESLIVNTEKKIADLEIVLEDYTAKEDAAKMQETCQELAVLHHSLDELFKRWEQLEAKSQPKQ